MALSERLAYILDFNVAGGIKSLEKVGQTAEKELGKAEQKLDKLSGNLSKFGAGAVAAAGVAGVALFKMGQGAAESEANLSALNQVLGETLAQDLAGWAEDGARNVGMSERAIYAAATSFGQLGKVAGLAGDELGEFTKRQITLAADMAAFKDVSPEQAIQDLTAAYAGSSETLQKYNVFVNDTNIKAAILSATGEKVTGTLTSQQRVMGINLLLMEQTADISGQWGRESGELAGQQAQLSANMQNLSDNIGRGVLPMLTELVGKGASVAGALASMDDATGGAIGRFAALGTGGLALVGTLSLVAGQVIKMRDLVTTLGKDGTRSLNNLGKAAKGLGVAMGVAGVALAAYQVHAQRAAHHTQTVIDKADELGRVADEQLGRVFTDAVLSGTLAGKSLDETMSDLARTNIEGARRMLEHAESTDVSSDAVDALREAIDGEEAARKQQATTTEEYGDALDDTTEATEDATDATNRSADAVRLQDEFVKGVNRTFAEQSTRLAEVAERTERFRKRAEELGTTWDRLKGKLSDRSAFLDVEDAFDSVQQAAEDAWDAAAEGSEDAERKARDYERAQISLKNAVIDYGTEVGDLPDQVLTNIIGLIDQGKLAEAEAALDRLERARTINYVPIVQPPRTPGGFRAMASGGRSPGGPTVVGERGPEVVDLPRGARVRSASETITDTRNSGGGGMSFTTVIEGNVYGVDHLQRVLDERDRRLAQQLRQGVRG